MQATLSYNAAGQRAGYNVTVGSTPYYAAQFSYRSGELGQAVIVSGTQAYTDTYLYTPEGAPLELIRQTATGGTLTTARYWYEEDGRGNVVALTDITGTVVDRYSYDVWGTLTSASESVPQRLRYAGYWYDQEFGWYWVGVRYYDPPLGRWLQPDPSQQDGVRTYVYVDDDPVDGIDPTGLAGGADEERVGEAAPLGEPLSSEDRVVWDLPALPDYASENDVTKLRNDTNEGRPLRAINAWRALTGPQGTDQVMVAGKGAPGGDVQFFKEGEPEPFLRREVKVMTSPKLNSFADQALRGAKQIGYQGEVWVEVPEPEGLSLGQFGTTRNLVKLRFANTISEIQKDGMTVAQFAKVRFTVFDTSGRLYAYQYTL